MIDTLEHAARECGDLLLALQQRELLVDEKRDEYLGAHFSTEADLRSQELGIRILHQKFPNEVVVAEEEQHVPQIPPDCTVFDPCDGTTLYYNGGREFGVTLCTLRGGEPLAGVLYFPADGMLIRAVRGQGCFINGTRIALRHEKPPDKILIGTDIGPWTVHEVLRPIAERFCVRSIMAAVFGFREVLLGQTGAYFNLNVAKIWDAAAGALAVREAGGVVYDVDGGQLAWTALRMDWVAAANDTLADTVLQRTRGWRQQPR